MASASALPDSFSKTCIYEAQAPVREVVRDLENIATAGKSFVSARKKWGWLSFVGFGVAVPLFAVLPVSIPAAIFGIYAFRRYRAYKRKCLEENLLGFVGKTLRLISADMGPDAPLSVRLDLRSHELPEKLTGEGQAGEWAVKHYTNPWLTLGGKLLDGSAFRLQMTTLFQARTKKKRNARGKTKIKTKNKQALRARLQLRVKPSRYASVEELARSARPAIKLPPTVVLRRFEATAVSLDMEAGAGEWNLEAPEGNAQVSGPHMVAMMFLSLYQILNLSREVSRRQQGGGQA